MYQELLRNLLTTSYWTQTRRMMYEVYGGGGYLVLGRGVLGGVREDGKESLSSSEVIQLSLSTALLFSSLLNK